MRSWFHFATQAGHRGQLGIVNIHLVYVIFPLMGFIHINHFTEWMCEIKPIFMLTWFIVLLWALWPVPWQLSHCFANQLCRVSRCGCSCSWASAILPARKPKWLVSKWFQWLARQCFVCQWQHIGRKCTLKKKKKYAVCKFICLDYVFIIFLAQVCHYQTLCLVSV